MQNEKKEYKIVLRAQFPSGRILTRRFFSSDTLALVADTLQLEDPAVEPVTSILHALPNGKRVVLDESLFDCSLAEIGFTRDPRVIVPLPAERNDDFVAETLAADAHFKVVARQFAKDAQAAAERAAVEGKCEEIILHFEDGEELKFNCLAEYTLGDLHDLACDELTARGVRVVYVRLFREPLQKGEYSLEDMEKTLGQLRLPGMLHACIVTEEEQSNEETEEQAEEGMDEGFEGEVEGESEERDHGNGGEERETEEGKGAEVSCLGLVETRNPEMQPEDSPTTSMTVHFEDGTSLAFLCTGDETLASLYEWIWERVTEREKSGNFDNLTLWRTSFRSDGLAGDSFSRSLRELALHGGLFACYDLHYAAAPEEEAQDGQGNERPEEGKTEETEEDVEEEEEKEGEEGEVIVTYEQSPIPISVHCRGTETLSSLSDRILGLLRARHGIAAGALLEIYRPEDVEGEAEVFGEDDMEKSLDELGLNLDYGTLFVALNLGGAPTLAQKSPVEQDQAMQKKQEEREMKTEEAKELKESDAETVEEKETQEGYGEEEDAEIEQTEDGEEEEIVEIGETEEGEEGETMEGGEMEEEKGEEEDCNLPSIQVTFFNCEHSSRHIEFHHDPRDTLGSFYRRMLARFRLGQSEVRELALFLEAYDEEQLGEEDMEKTLEELGITHRGALFAFYKGEEQTEEAEEPSAGDEEGDFEEEEDEEEEVEEEEELDITIKFNNSMDPVEMGFDKCDTLSSLYEVALSAVQMFHLEVTELTLSRSPFFVPFAEGDMRKSLLELGVISEIYAFFDIPNSA